MINEAILLRYLNPQIYFHKQKVKRKNTGLPQVDILTVVKQTCGLQHLDWSLWNTKKEGGFFVEGNI